MRRTRFDDATCPLARTSDLLGDWWSPLILRDLLLGHRRFNDLENSLGISRGVLAERLRRFEEEGLIERHCYQDRPPRHDYVLTEKGSALWGVLAAMWQYGDEWLFDERNGPRVELRDARSGSKIRPQMIDGTTGQPLDLSATRVKVRG